METRSSKNVKMEKVKYRKLNVARVLVVLLFIYLLVCFILYVYKEPVRHYEINGNNLLSDVEIIRELHLEDYPSFVSLNTSKLEKKLSKNVFVKSAKITYSWDFVLNIEIEENKPVLAMKLEDKICLADGTLIDYDDRYAVGIPTLLNSTPTKILKTLAKNLDKIDDGILYIINDIEYKPSYNSSNQVIDEYRFLFSMNDKNMVYINAKRMKSLNKYLDIIATNKITSTGTLYLDGTEDNYFFKVRN